MRLDVNTDATIQLTAKLEKLHRSAFPSAVRNTLNQCAFDMKKKQIPDSADSVFNLKSGTKTALKKLTIIEKANGFDVRTMNAKVGFRAGGNDSLGGFVRGLEKQEKGGRFENGMRYLKEARGTKNGRVRSANYYDKNKIISGKNRGKGTRKSKFVARAYASKKANKPMFMNSMKGNFVVQTKTFKKDKSGKLNIKFKFLMMSRKSKPSKVKATNFIEEAGKVQAKLMPSIYQKQAEYQFKKYMQ